MLDASFQTLGAALSIGKDQPAYLMVGMESFDIHGPLHTVAWAWTGIRSDNNLGEDILIGDIRLLDAAGTVLCEIAGVRLKKTNRDALLVKVKNGKVQGKMSLVDFNTVISVDLVGVFLCGREAAVHMIEGGCGGVIINISSISRAGNIGQTNYSAAKAGVAAMTVTWAKELARYKIRVAGIAPGFCDTRMVGKIPPKILDKIISTIPLRRLAEPEEIASTALFILQNDFYDGRVLEIDGGLRL